MQPTGEEEAPPPREADNWRVRRARRRFVWLFLSSLIQRGAGRTSRTQPARLRHRLCRAAAARRGGGARRLCCCCCAIIVAASAIWRPGRRPGSCARSKATPARKQKTREEKTTNEEEAPAEEARARQTRARRQESFQIAVVSSRQAGGRRPASQSGAVRSRPARAAFGSRRATAPASRWRRNCHHGRRPAVRVAPAAVAGLPEA
jgi:hypothetical protein